MPPRNKFHQLMLPNVDDVVPLISKYITNQNPEPTLIKVRQEAMKCFQV